MSIHTETGDQAMTHRAAQITRETDRARSGLFGAGAGSACAWPCTAQPTVRSQTPGSNWPRWPWSLSPASTFRVSALEWGILELTIFVILALEGVNTAVEGHRRPGLSPPTIPWPAWPKMRQPARCLWRAGQPACRNPRGDLRAALWHYLRMAQARTRAKPIQQVSASRSASPASQAALPRICVSRHFPLCPAPSPRYNRAGSTRQA